MRFAVIGAGAIGAYVGASLAKAGADVTLVARGAHLRAMQEQGVRVLSERGEFHVHPAATDRCETIGTVDCVIVALKAHQIVGMLDAMAPLFGPQTQVIAMQNGIPWWYFQNHGGELEGLVLESVDAGGVLARTFDPNRVIGCAVYSSTEIVGPGVIKHVEGTRYSLGHPSGEVTPAIEAISQAFVAGGLKAPVETDLRRDVWTKLLGNVCLNPISALTRATLVDMATHRLVEPLLREMMAESLAIATRLGVVLSVSIDKRVDGARRVGPHKTSTLQDIEAGRGLEIDCIVGAVVELGERLDIPVPATRHVYALTKLLDESTQHAVAAKQAGREADRHSG
ncbi:MAG: 2-dehydropantoate 2-reductase [Vulcanimicrobiaceae bacterium]